MAVKVCSVVDGKITYLKSDTCLPDQVVKVKHEPRELHPEYRQHLREYIENRVKLKKEFQIKEAEYLKRIKILDRLAFKHCIQNIEKWFN